MNAHAVARSMTAEELAEQRRDLRRQKREQRHETRRTARAEDLPELAIVSEVAQVLGVSDGVVRGMARAGTLVEIRVGRLTRITRESVLALVGK